MEVLTYAPSSVILLVSGLAISGWDRIAITPNSPVFRQIRGIRGKNTRTRIKDTSATVVIEVPQTELINEVFSKIVEADSVIGNVRLELTLKEMTGSTLFTTTVAYIDSRPEVVYTDKMEKRVWTIRCDESNMYVGAARNPALGIVQDGIARLQDFVNDIG
jgi:hypothetical protein